MFFLHCPRSRDSELIEQRQESVVWLSSEEIVQCGDDASSADLDYIHIQLCHTLQSTALLRQFYSSPTNSTLIFPALKN